MILPQLASQMKIELKRCWLLHARCFAFALLLGSCAAPNPVGKIRDIAITEVHRSDGGGCRDWVATEASARKFFAHAILITGEVHHHGYDTYSCWARGTFVVGSEIWEWEMNAGGAANVFPPGRPQFLVADPTKRVAAGE